MGDLPGIIRVLNTLCSFRGNREAKRKANSRAQITLTHDRESPR